MIKQTPIPFSERVKQFIACHDALQELCTSVQERADAKTIETLHKSALTALENGPVYHATGPDELINRWHDLVNEFSQLHPGSIKPRHTADLLEMYKRLTDEQTQMLFKNGMGPNEENTENNILTIRTREAKALQPTQSPEKALAIATEGMEHGTEEYRISKAELLGDICNVQYPRYVFLKPYIRDLDAKDIDALFTYVSNSIDNVEHPSPLQMRGFVNKVAELSGNMPENTIAYSREPNDPAKKKAQALRAVAGDPVAIDDFFYRIGLPKLDCDSSALDHKTAAPIIQKITAAEADRFITKDEWDGIIDALQEACEHIPETTAPPYNPPATLQLPNVPGR